MNQPKFGMRKTTEDGVFSVYIMSDGFSPANENERISETSFRQLIELLEGVATLLRTTTGITKPLM